MYQIDGLIKPNQLNMARRHTKLNDDSNQPHYVIIAVSNNVIREGNKF